MLYIFSIQTTAGHIMFNLNKAWCIAFVSLFVVVNFDALAQASDFRIERRRVVFLTRAQLRMRQSYNKVRSATLNMTHIRLPFEIKQRLHVRYVIILYWEKYPALNTEYVMLSTSQWDHHPFPLCRTLTAVWENITPHWYRRCVWDNDHGKRSKLYKLAVMFKFAL